MIDNPIALARQLKGAPLSILFCLSCVRQPVTHKWLVSMTGYSSNIITSALRTLHEYSLVACDARRSSWQLAGDAVQLPLGAALLENPDREKCDLDRDIRDQESPDEPATASESAPDREKRDLDRVNRDLEESLEVKEVKTDLTDLTDLDSSLSRLSASQILLAARRLFGKTIRGKPGEYPDSALLLAWIAQAWDTRGNGVGETRQPAGLVYWAFHAGRDKSAPDPAYLADPLHYLPDDFLADLGLLPEDPPDGIEMGLPEEPNPLPVPPAPEQAAWRIACEQLAHEAPAALEHLARAVLVALEPGLATIRAVNAYERDWIDGRLSATLARVLSGICNQTITVRVVAD